MDDCKRVFDFSSFTASTTDIRAKSTGSNVRTTVRTVFGYEVEESGKLVKLKISASGFLYKMARTMAGTLVYVSEGKIRPEDIRKIFETGDRKNAGPVLPACGLYLTGLSYGGK